MTQTDDAAVCIAMSLVCDNKAKQASLLQFVLREQTFIHVKEGRGHLELQHLHFNKV